MWAIYPGRNLNNEWDIVKTLKKNLHYSGEQKYKTINFIRLNYMKLLLFKKITSLIEFSMIQSYIKSLNEITSQHNRNISHLQRAKKKEQLKRLRKAAQQKWNLNSTFKNLKELDIECLWKLYYFISLLASFRLY